MGEGEGNKLPARVFTLFLEIMANHSSNMSAHIGPQGACVSHIKAIIISIQRRHLTTIQPSPCNVLWTRSILLIKLHVVCWEQTHLAIVLASPPVLVRELQVGNFGILREADF